jgi:hypothetical protein
LRRGCFLSTAPLLASFLLPGANAVQCGVVEFGLVAFVDASHCDLDWVLVSWLDLRSDSSLAMTLDFWCWSDIVDVLDGFAGAPVDLITVLACYACDGQGADPAAAEPRWCVPAHEDLVADLVRGGLAVAFVVATPVSCQIFFGQLLSFLGGCLDSLVVHVPLTRTRDLESQKELTG